MKDIFKDKDLFSTAVFVCFFWSGLVLGISFLEAPLKFQAPGITLPLGLGIGRLVFGALNKIEIVLMSVLMIVWYITTPGRHIRYHLILLVVILLIQSLWLLPALDERAEYIIQNKPLEEGNSPHIFYVLGELVKLVNLIITGFVFMRARPIEEPQPEK